MVGNNKIAVPGFRVGGARGRKYGLAMVVCDEKARCSVMATSNKVRAAPVDLSTAHAKDGWAQAVVISSGNANAFTGGQGRKDAERMCGLTGELLGVEKEDVIVNSTGIIGQRLEMDDIESLIKGVSEDLRYDDRGIEKAAQAMRTTDSFTKISSREINFGSRGTVKMTGFAKGAGMISPDMHHATMIAIILTDAYFPDGEIDNALKEAIEDTFNMINVDGDTSTNDMVVLISSGKGGGSIMDDRVQSGLNEVCLDLAKMIVRDGEGATKLFTMEIRGAKSRGDARLAARAVVSSTLVKTAVFGENPNWGRVVAAIGYSGAEFDPSKLSLTLKNDKDEVLLVKDGEGVALKGSEEIARAGEILKSREFTFTASIGVGSGSAKAYGCDLGHNYVKVNAEYTT